MKNRPSSSMHWGLNAQLLSLQQSYRSAGISWYIYHLLTNLSKHAARRYTVFANDAQFQPAPPLNVARTRFPTQRPWARILWEQLALPLELRRRHIDALHSMAFVSPYLTKLPQVVTIYDLSFLRFPDAFRPLQRFYLSHFTRQTAQQANAIIAISESTRRDVIDYFGVPPERVHTIYCGADAAFKPLPVAEVDRFRAAKGLPPRFVFRLGTLEPRKNVEGVIRAYAQWRQRDPQAPPLVVAGGKGWYYEAIFALVQTLNLTDYVIFPGYVPQADLPLWYNAADFFVYPSYFEGFGLPVLEAMACGTPTITSNVSSLPEVAGDAGILVDPNDTAALSLAMQQLGTNANKRAEFGRRGLAQAAQFSWPKAAAQTEALYNSLS